MRKFIFVLSMFFGLAFESYAETSVTGQTITINGLAVNKTATELTFDGDNVILHFSDGTSQSADMESVSIVFNNSTTGLNQIQTFVFNDIADGSLDVSGIQPGQMLEVFDVSGRKVLTTKVSVNNTHVDISNFRPGVYILRAGNNIIKFTKR